LQREGRYGEARDAFRALASTRSGVDERVEALLGAGTAAFELNDAQSGFESYEAALKAAPPESDAAVKARYLLLKRLNDAGRRSEAARLFLEAPGAGAGSPIGPYFRFEGGRAQEGAAGLAVWRELLGDPAVSGALKTSIRRESVVRWREVGDVEALKAALDALIADTGDAAARYERAELAAAAGDSFTRAAQLRAIVAESPGSRHAAAALEELTSAGEAVDPGQAGLSYYRRELYAQAIAVLEPSLAEAPTANELAFRAYYLAASYEDSGQGTNAIRYYDMAAQSGATSQFVHRAKYWGARTAEWASTAQDASARYVALAQFGPRGEFSEEAAFRGGYVLYLAGDTAGALAAWEALASSGGARMEYWRGRALAAAGDSAGARAAYERAVALGPLDLHGIEARAELEGRAPMDVRYRERDIGKGVDWAAIASWLSLRIGGGPQGSAPTAACDLSTAGLRAEAAAEIWAANARGGTWRSFELMREASMCGLADVAARLAVAIRQEAGVASHEPPKDLLRVSYPIDYGATLVAEARKANVDPLFYAALIRQESFWDPSALSPADARGLTQVIPPTGSAIAAELGVPEFEPSNLYRPALSLEFGAYYLGGQLRRYGHPLFALSAYNAGPGNAARWAASGATRAADVAEVIDFLETRNYVAYISEAYAHYQLAWGD